MHILMKYTYVTINFVCEVKLIATSIFILNKQKNVISTHFDSIFWCVIICKCNNTKFKLMWTDSQHCEGVLITLELRLPNSCINFT